MRLPRYKAIVARTRRRQWKLLAKAADSVRRLTGDVAIVHFSHDAATPALRGKTFEFRIDNGVVIGLPAKPTTQDWFHASVKLSG